MDYTNFQTNKSEVFVRKQCSLKFRMSRKWDEHARSERAEGRRKVFRRIAMITKWIFRLNILFWWQSHCHQFIFGFMIIFISRFFACFRYQSRQLSQKEKNKTFLVEYELGRLISNESTFVRWQRRHNNISWTHKKKHTESVSISYSIVCVRVSIVCRFRIRLDAKLSRHLHKWICLKRTWFDCTSNRSSFSYFWWYFCVHSIIWNANVNKKKRAFQTPDHVSGTRFELCMCQESAYVCVSIATWLNPYVRKLSQRWWASVRFDTYTNQFTCSKITNVDSLVRARGRKEKKHSTVWKTGYKCK